jgi:hypothetical protein
MFDKKAYNRKYAKEHPDMVQKWIRNHPEYRKEKYGFTKESFNELLEFQDGRCLICGELMKIPHIDHDHKTGKIRGLLCLKCNAILGMANDDIEILKRAIRYLESTKAGSKL